MKPCRSTYLVTKPVLLTSIFLKSEVEKKDGSLQISRVTNLNSEYDKKYLEYIKQARVNVTFQYYQCLDALYGIID